MNQPSTTLDIAGAKLMVPTGDLFRAWMREQIAPSSISGAIQILQIPHLNAGEVYVGAFASADGAHMHHTILLPMDRDDAPWNEHMVWAKGEGFDLPNRLELLMMWTSMRNRFQKKAYWSNEMHHEDSSSAWCQYFGYGSQDYRRKSAALRAVAVRRFPL